MGMNDCVCPFDRWDQYAVSDHSRTVTWHLNWDALFPIVIQFDARALPRIGCCCNLHAATETAPVLYPQLLVEVVGHRSGPATRVHPSPWPTPLRPRTAIFVEHRGTH